MMPNSHCILRGIKVGAAVLLIVYLLLWIAVGQDAQFWFTSKWEFTPGETSLLMATNGVKLCTITRFQIGPMVVEHYSSE